MGKISQPNELATFAALRAAILAANPSVYYICNDAGVTLVDSTTGGRNLTASGAPDPQDSVLVPADPNGLYLRLPTGANKYLATNTLAVPFNADWTFFGIATILDLSEAVNLFSVGGAGELEAANYQIAVGALAATGEINCFWESGAGVDNTIASGIALREGIPYALAQRKNGTANTIEFFINAIKVATIGYANEPTGGTATDLAVGDVAAATTASFLAGHFAFWNGVALTNAQIVNITRAAGMFGPP